MSDVPEDLVLAFLHQMQDLIRRELAEILSIAGEMDVEDSKRFAFAILGMSTASAVLLRVSQMLAEELILEKDIETFYKNQEELVIFAADAAAANLYPHLKEIFKKRRGFGG